MSAQAQEEPHVETQQPERLVRSFASEITVGDGRTLDVRIVPYNEEIITGDPPWAPKELYRESFAPGAFDHQLNAANRVLMNAMHEQGLRGVIGGGKMLRSAADALYGTFRLLKNPDADKALELAQEGHLAAVSLEFQPMRSVRRNDGLVQRVKAHLDTVSLVPEGGYPGAEVLGFRSNHVMVEGDEDFAQPLDPALGALLRSVGLDVPAKLLPTQSESLMRMFVDAAWNGDASRWPDAESYCASCLVDNNPAGEPKTKDQCHLPVKDPGSSDINVNALRAIVGGRGAQADFPGAAAARAEAQRMLDEFSAKKA